MAQWDPHSYNDSTQTDVRSFDWKARVDFQQRVLHAEITLHLAAASEGALDLDTRDLQIERAHNERGEPVPFELYAAEPILGARLGLVLPPKTTQVTIHYRTSPSSSALQWLEPIQTSGGIQPFLYSQCQAIHARSVIPIQDTPRVRVTFRAALTVPQALRSVMAARSGERVVLGNVATDHFDMPQPIPPYLLAFAVGDLVSQDVGPRSRVWAEPAVVDDAAWEFADVETLIVTAEKLFGPYDWERFDILTMPPSFPYGGMENPRLTFLTPTLLAKDRSLVHVLAHELAHSWTGNLVTNANAEHFWLNEGFTVFAERRILEAVEAPEMSAFHAALGLQSLERAIVQFRQRPEHTRLRTHLKGVDPDDVFSQVPYEKGYLFLRTIENAVGREKFDRFLQAYVAQYRFQSLTTEEFVLFLEKQLPGAFEKVNGHAWVDEPGLPSQAPRPSSARLEALQTVKGLPEEETAKRWTPAEWQLYLESLPRPIAPDLCEGLNARYHLTESRNSEILVAWLTLAVEANDAKAIARTEDYLERVGRLKYVKPLYQALMNSTRGKQGAMLLFERVKEAYHPITRTVVESLLQT